MADRNETAPTSAQVAFAWGVHFYTAFGAVLGFLALWAAFQQNYTEVFWLLSVALLVDSTDGTFARRARVKQVVPWINGEQLDNIVDYLTYVVVPVAIFVQPGILPHGTQSLALLVLLASAYGFSRTDAKGFVEHYFQGFPSYWNVVAFYYVILETNPTFNLLLLMVFVALVFVPMRWLYPSRMEKQRTQALALGALWAVMGLTLIWQMPHPSKTLGWISLFYPLYYTVMSVRYHFSTE
ncbi:MAG TPA: CDP-diacylglycerol O-phosphatidyltransferase [Candidatus Binatia bacterium]|nr:CDP-diacylglycerol O-phosphatidyltransferase [Candidatus Binatia bacterium]